MNLNLPIQFVYVKYLGYVPAKTELVGINTMSVAELTGVFVFISEDADGTLKLGCSIGMNAGEIVLTSPFEIKKDDIIDMLFLEIQTPE